MEAKHEEPGDPMRIYFSVVSQKLRTDSRIRIVDDRDDGDDDEQSSTVAALRDSLMGYYYNFRPYLLGSVSDGKLALDSQAAGTLLEPDVALLLQHAQPASFGQGDQTVYDENVRLAKSLVGERLEQKSWLMNSVKQEICRVATLLNPHGAVRLVLSKLHIYEAGGHFAQHRDTVRSNDHIGSVVVLLGSNFTGGEFVINGEVCPLEIDRDAENPKLPFVAFYTDVTHEVRHVTSGVRVSLQFDVFQSSSSSRYDEDDWSPPLDELFTREPKTVPFVDEAQCDEVVENVMARLRQYKRHLILPAFHYYTQHALHTSNLKSVDAALAQKLAEHGCPVTPAPLNIVEERDEEDTGNCSIGASIFWQDPYCRDKPLTVPDGTELLRLRTMHGEVLESQPYIEYTGNEAQLGSYACYFSGLLVGPPEQKSAAKKRGKKRGRGAAK